MKCFNNIWKNLISVLLALSILVCFVGCSASQSAPLCDDTSELKYLINHGMKYILNDFWNEERYYVFSKSSNKVEEYILTETQKDEVLNSQKSFLNWRDEEYLKIIVSEVNQENSIRPLAHVCHVLSTALKYNFYDEAAVGIPVKEAKAMTVKLITSLAKMHLANTSGGWGNTWQSAMWAELIGSSAWILSDSVSEVDWKYVENMVHYESERFINYEVPYYMDKSGNVLYPGDTKGEENAWNQRILALAYCMFPDDENRQQYKDKAIEMLLSSVAMQKDLNSNEIVDGFNVSDTIKGTNFNSDGTVINHGRIHIDYMVSPCEGMMETLLLFAIAGEQAPEAALHNLDGIYHALVYCDLGMYDQSKIGHHFYERSATGNVSASTNMPNNNDWGSVRQANYYLMDTAAELFNLDKQCEAKYKAALWGHERIIRLKEMTKRKSEEIISGRFYEDGEENFVSGEVFATDCLVQAYLLRMLC